MNFQSAHGGLVRWLLAGLISADTLKSSVYTCHKEFSQRLGNDIGPSRVVPSGVLARGYGTMHLQSPSHNVGGSDCIRRT